MDDCPEAPDKDSNSPTLTNRAWGTLKFKIKTWGTRPALDSPLDAIFMRMSLPEPRAAKLPARTGMGPFHQVTPNDYSLGGCFVVGGLPAPGPKSCGTSGSQSGVFSWGGLQGFRPRGILRTQYAFTSSCMAGQRSSEPAPSSATWRSPTINNARNDSSRARARLKMAYGCE